MPIRRPARTPPVDGLQPRLAVVGAEVALARAAHRTHPVVRDVLEGGPRWDAAIGVTVRGVVDEPARLAHPELGLLLPGPDLHAAKGYKADLAYIGRSRVATWTSTGRRPTRSSTSGRRPSRVRPRRRSSSATASRGWRAFSSSAIPRPAS